MGPQSCDWKPRSLDDGLYALWLSSGQEDDKVWTISPPWIPKKPVGCTVACREPQPANEATLARNCAALHGQHRFLYPYVYYSLCILPVYQPASYIAKGRRKSGNKRLRQTERGLTPQIRRKHKPSKQIFSCKHPPEIATCLSTRPLGLRCSSRPKGLQSPVSG